MILGSLPCGTKNARDIASSRSCGNDAVRGEKVSQSWCLQSTATISCGRYMIRFVATERRNLQKNEIDSGVRDRCGGWDSYTAAEGAEGAAADIAVGGLLERRRRLHGLPLMQRRIWSQAAPAYLASPI